MKPGPAFKLSKTTKRMMCFIKNKESRDQFKRMMIDAQLTAEQKISSGKDKD